MSSKITKPFLGRKESLSGCGSFSLPGDLAVARRLVSVQITALLLLGLLSAHRAWLQVPGTRRCHLLPKLCVVQPAAGRPREARWRHLLSQCLWQERICLSGAGSQPWPCLHLQQLWALVRGGAPGALQGEWPPLASTHWIPIAPCPVGNMENVPGPCQRSLGRGGKVLPC